MDGVAPPAELDDILVTAELSRRPARAPDFAAENHALVELAQTMVHAPHTLLQCLVDVAVDLCQAGSAGISLLEPGAEPPIFRWVALSGAFAPYVGGTTPRDFSPCGTCLDRGAPQLYADPARYFSYIAAVDIPIIEGLVLPMYGPDGPLGTIWIVAHDAERHFDREDVRLMTSLGAFTVAALHMVAASDTAKQAAARAEAALSARDQFISLAVHELRTPLTSLLGYAQLLERRVTREESLSERNQQAVHIIAEQAIQLTKMMDSLLTVTRIQAGRLNIQRAPVDLCQLIQRVVETMQPTLTAYTLTAHVPTEPVIIAGDELRLEQVVRNLLDNAIKYSPAGGPVDVWVSQQGGRAIVQVSDRGIGIAAAEVPRLFDRFYQASNAKEQHKRGMGIGLYVVKEIITLHGGSVDVVSQEGTGSTFTLSLPLGDTAHDVPRAPQL